MKTFLTITLSLLCLSAFSACQQQSAPTSEQTADKNTFFSIQIGEAPIELQLAIHKPEQTRGLMFRDSMGYNEGMLFLFERPSLRSFWMKDTRIPLDIGYFDSSGKLIEVHKLYPYDQTPVRSSSHEILIAIETNRGWYADNGVKPGATIDMEALREALQRRQFKHPLL